MIMDGRSSRHKNHDGKFSLIDHFVARGREDSSQQAAAAAAAAAAPVTAAAAAAAVIGAPAADETPDFFFWFGLEDRMMTDDSFG